MNTKIEWTDKVWNPITGCTPISEGCEHCYAKRRATRMAGMFGYPKENPFAITFHHERLERPLRWKKPCRIFVNSMGDLFHENVNVEWIIEMLEVVRECRQHDFQVLTKRPGQMMSVFDDIDRRYLSYRGVNSRSCVMNNLWTGVTVESAKHRDRIDTLRRRPASVRFISFEPLLDDVGELDLTGIHWVIVGGETGPGARPMNSDWARSIRDQCRAANVPFFFKKTGTALGNQGYLDNQYYREFPKGAAK